jgi:hypothetical protein
VCELIQLILREVVWVHEIVAVWQYHRLKVIRRVGEIWAWENDVPLEVAQCSQDDISVVSPLQIFNFFRHYISIKL